MADNREKLFVEFPDVTTEQWEAVITADLKGADYDKKLVWRTQEGFNVRPYYRAENLADVKHLASSAGEFPYVRGIKKSNDWRIHQTINVSDVLTSNEQAKKAIEAGATSIGFRMQEQLDRPQIKSLLGGIDLNTIEIVFSERRVRRMVEDILAVAEELGAKKEEARLMFILDPLMRHLSLQGDVKQKDIRETYSILADLITKTADWKHIRLIGVSGELFGNSGATITQELGYTLAVGHEYIAGLLEAGLPIDLIARRIRFSMSVSSNYFMELAKFRAARILWANIVNAYKPERGCSEKMFVHAVTSKWNLTSYDPYSNMLRGTTEAMSASLAGVQSLEVTPFDASYEQPTEFAERIARNVQLLLKHESHFNSVIDPAGGSYYIETLTQSIAEQAWKLFCETESAGGYVAAFRAGNIVEAVEQSAAAKDKAVATRRTILLGTNQYPNFTETASDLPPVTERKAGVLNPYRGGEPFEQLRLSVDGKNRRPRAFMLTCGTLAMARARAQFSSNFFAVAGIEPQDNVFFSSVEAGAEAAAKSGAEIVVICASDDDYTTLAPIAKKMIGSEQIFVVAGEPTCRPELEAVGITNFISVRSNVLETLKEYVAQLK